MSGTVGRKKSKRPNQPSNGGTNRPNQTLEEQLKAAEEKVQTLQVQLKAAEDLVQILQKLFESRNSRDNHGSS